MYTAYWKLNARPFDNGCDPQFYYPSESHQVTLLKLRYALDHPRGAALLAGVAGLGKSLLAQTLLADLPESFGPLIYVKFPQMSPPQLSGADRGRTDRQKHGRRHGGSQRARDPANVEQERAGGPPRGDRH